MHANSVPGVSAKASNYNYIPLSGGSAMNWYKLSLKEKYSHISTSGQVDRASSPTCDANPSRLLYHPNPMGIFFLVSSISRVFPAICIPFQYNPSCAVYQQTPAGKAMVHRAKMPAVYTGKKREMSKTFTAALPRSVVVEGTFQVCDLLNHMRLLGYRDMRAGWLFKFTVEVEKSHQVLTE